MVDKTHVVEREKQPGFGAKPAGGGYWWDPDVGGRDVCSWVLERMSETAFWFPAMDYKCIASFCKDRNERFCHWRRSREYVFMHFKFDVVLTVHRP